LAIGAAENSDQGRDRGYKAVTGIFYDIFQYIRRYLVDLPDSG
jgi:hypothetical protein